MFNQKLNFKRQNLSNMVNSGMPNMADTLNGWEVPLTLTKITQSIVEGEKVETQTNISFMGVFQPLRMEQLKAYAEELRSWQWVWIHAKSGELNLMTGDKIIFNNIRYKVMNKKDYSLNGYVEYECVEDFNNYE